MIPLDDPNQTRGQEEPEQVEGVIADDGEALSLDLSDEEVAAIIGNRVKSAEEWWNKTLDLKNVREKAERYYLNKPFEDSDLYEYQVPYKNNRILTAVESLVPMVIAQPAEPIVTEAKDTDESRQLALDLTNVLMTLYRTMFIKSKLSKVVRHLMMGKRIGVLKYRFDPNQGELLPDGTRKGKIVAEVVRPEKIVFEKESNDPENCTLIAEYCADTVENLILRFPDKKDAIFKQFDIVKGTKSQLQKIVGYIEVWFTYYDKNGDPQEGVAWKIDKLILGFIKNPNWNYDEFKMDEQTGENVQLNFLDRPAKPYIIFQHLNTGKYIIDDTSLLDQSIYLQDVLNKRGRQVTESADQAQGGLVLNSDMIDQEDAKKLTGDPTEKIMVGGDVRAAALRLPLNEMPAYVLNDKADARAEIDNIFGANPPIRGQQSGNPTLGQDILSQRANLGRLQTVADSIEDGMTRFYNHMVQMMKVFWDDDEILRFQMGQGKTRFIAWNQNKIEPGVQIEVAAGSAMPKDKLAIRQETIQSIGILDPLSIAEGLDKPNPKEFAKRITYYRFFMDKYLEEYLDGSDGVNAKALADIQAIMNGVTPDVPQEPEKDYLATMQMYLESDGFKRIDDPALQQKIIAFVEQANNAAKSAIGQPTGDEGAQPPAPGEQAPAGAPAGGFGAPTPPTPFPRGQGTARTFGNTALK